MIICHCAHVTDVDIKNAIGRGVTSVDGLVEETGAGQCCSPCRDEVASILMAESGGADTR